MPHDCSCHCIPHWYYTTHSLIQVQTTTTIHHPVSYSIPCSSSSSSIPTFSFDSAAAIDYVSSFLAYFPFPLLFAKHHLCYSVCLWSCSELSLESSDSLFWNGLVGVLNSAWTCFWRVACSCSRYESLLAVSVLELVFLIGARYGQDLCWIGWLLSIVQFDDRVRLDRPWHLKSQNFESSWKSDVIFAFSLFQFSLVSTSCRCSFLYFLCSRWPAEVVSLGGVEFAQIDLRWRILAPNCIGLARCFVHGPLSLLFLCILRWTFWVLPMPL